MWRMVVTVLLMAGISVSGQDRDGMVEIMRFLGAESPEEMDDQVVERLADYIQRPLKIGRAHV